MGAFACTELVSRRLQQYTEAFAHGADASNWAGAKQFSGSRFSLDLVPVEVRGCVHVVSAGTMRSSRNLRGRSKTHAAGASPCVGAAAAAVLVGSLPGGSVGHGDEGRGNY